MLITVVLAAGVWVGPVSGGEAVPFSNPSKVRTIHAVILSHLDIGFTGTPDAVAAGQKASIDAALRIGRERPEAVWTIESAWQLEEWLRRTEDPSEVDELVRQVRENRMASGRSTRRSTRGS